MKQLAIGVAKIVSGAVVTVATLFLSYNVALFWMEVWHSMWGLPRLGLLLAYVFCGVFTLRNGISQVRRSN